MGFDLFITARDCLDDYLFFMENLNNQNYTDDVRVVFVNQGIINETVDKIDTFENSNLSVEYINASPMPLSLARNLAIKNGLLNDIIAFPDDDCWYEPNLLKNISKEFSDNPELDCICTNVYDPISKKTYGGRPEFGRIAVDYRNIFSLPISVGIFVKKSALLKAGPYFDTQFGAGTELGSGEETELISRLITTGSKILYIGDLSVYHRVPIYSSNDYMKFRKYACGFSYLCMKFIFHKNYIVLAKLIEVCVRSISGFLFYFSKPNYRKVYAGRLLGIFEGIKRYIFDNLADKLD